MQIQVTHPDCGADLVRFLHRMGFTARESGIRTVRVDLGDEDPAARGAQVMVYFHVWQTRRREALALLEPDERS